MQYRLPASVVGSSALWIRWKLSKSVGNPQVELGWHLDDVVILGDGANDTDPPVAELSIILGNPGETVALEWSADLLTWNPLTTATLSPEGTLTLDDPDSAEAPKRFYRMRTAP